MTRRTRNLLMVAFMAGFCVVAPLVLLWTAGYKYNWKKRKVEKTGIIQTDSEPTGATVFINDVNRGLKTPAALPRLLPEDYVVRFEKTGYLPWEKRVEVWSGNTTFVTGAALIKDALPEMQTGVVAEKTAFSRNGQYVAYIASSQEGGELYIANSDGKGAVLLARLSNNARVEHALLWSPVGNRVLHTTKNKDGAIAAVLYDAKDNNSARSIQDLIGKSRIRRVSWTSDGLQIMVETAGGWSVVDPDTGSVVLVAAGDKTMDADLRGRDTFTIRADSAGIEIVTGTLGSTNAPRVLSKLPSGRYSFVREEGPYLLVTDVGKDKLLALSFNDGAVIDELPGKNARWFPSGREPRLLAWNDFEITVADVRAKEHRLVTRLGTAITNCEWHPSGLAVFYSAGNTLRVADVDAHEPRNVFSLAAFNSLGDFTVDTAKKMIRFSGAVGTQQGIFSREY